MSNIAKINDLPVDNKANLTADMKKGLIKIVREEFSNQATTMNDDTRAAKDKVVKAYRKSHGIDKLVTSYRKASEVCGRMHRELQALGFETNGDHKPYGLPKDLEEALSKVNEKMRKPISLRNKIEARLLIASTVGDAVVILHQVMGNDILPSVTKEEIQLLIEE